MWWKGAPRIKLGETVVGLLFVAGVFAGGWLLNQLIIRSFRPLVRPMTFSGSSPEPTRLDQFRIEARQFLGQNDDWLVGASLTLVTIYCLKVVAVSCQKRWQLRRQNDVVDERIAVGNQLIGGLFGLAIFGSLLLAWIETFV